MPMPELRSATVTDIPAVLAFWQHAAEDSHRPVDSSHALEALLGRDPEALLLAVDPADGLVGSIIAGWDGWRCHIYRLAVHEAHRRRGIGRMLIDAAEVRFRGFGGTRADAMVLDGNDLAHHAWSARGYVPQGEWSRWIKLL